MDVMGINGYVSAQMSQKLQGVQSQVGVDMLSKAMDNQEQGAAVLVEGMERANAKAAEMAVNPYVGGNFDMFA